MSTTNINIRIDKTLKQDVEIKQVMNDVLNNKNLSKSFNSVHDLMKYLNA